MRKNIIRRKTENTIERNNLEEKMGDDNRNFMNNQNGQNNSGGNNGNKKDDKKNTNRMSLLISMVSALIMIIGFMWVMKDMESKSTEEITYNEFIQYLEEDKIERVEINKDILLVFFRLLSPPPLFPPPLLRLFIGFLLSSLMLILQIVTLYSIFGFTPNYILSHNVL
jgi:ATP-dependent Zn protease